MSMLGMFWLHIISCTQILFQLACVQFVRRQANQIPEKLILCIKQAALYTEHKVFALFKVFPSYIHAVCFITECF